MSTPDAPAPVATPSLRTILPSIVIDGHYTTSPALAGHGLSSEPAAFAALFNVMDSLVAKSAAERAAKK